MAGNNTYTLVKIPLAKATTIVRIPHPQQAVLHIFHALQRDAAGVKSATGLDGIKIDWYLHSGALPAIGTTVAKYPTDLEIPTDAAPVHAECCRALAQLTDGGSPSGEIHLYNESGWHFNSMRQDGGIQETGSWIVITTTSPGAAKFLDIMALFRSEKF